MKKIITFIIILGCILPLGKSLLDSQLESNNDKDKTSISKNSSSSKEDDSTLLDIYNKEKKESDSTSSEIDNNENKESNSILVNAGYNEYVVAVDYNTKEVIINENLHDSDKYIKVDYEKILPVLKNIDDPKNLSISQYINLYNKVSPHIDTNMSYSELLSIASNININDLKSSYNNLTKNTK